ncbi:hypothetical protein DPMN_126104 [Dreissena polymorpha]|uniref:Uncharacterized protein n=1 Tax=Dreissena polymorpha TaxID=45954 RepID=A0A9D4JTM8_DREPO|nr:hypothetical protein DPMN_126104 [Dreissena polymorpha]
MYAFGISLLVAATTTLQSPHLSVKVLHDNALQLLCDAIDAETDVIRFYRNTTLEGFVSIFKFSNDARVSTETFSTMAAKAPFSAISSKTDSHVNTSPHIATEEGTTQKSSVEGIITISV